MTDRRGETGRVTWGAGEGGRVKIFLLQRGDKSVKGGGRGIDVKMGGVPLFHYFTVYF